MDKQVKIHFERISWIWPGEKSTAKSIFHDINKIDSEFNLFPAETVTRCDFCRLQNKAFPDSEISEWYVLYMEGSATKVKETEEIRTNIHKFPAVWIDLGTKNEDDIKNIMKEITLEPSIIEKRITKESEKVGQSIPLAVDGVYDVKVTKVHLINKNTNFGLLIFYKPRIEIPILLECLEILKERLPLAFRKKLISKVSEPPWIGSGGVSLIDTNVLGNLEKIRLTNEVELLLEDEPEKEKLITQFRKAIEGNGSEAMGWYQSFHKYEDGYWGIYLNSDKIIGAALALYDDMKDAGFDDFIKALKTILWKVGQHEMFHLQVDSFALLQESSRLRPCYLDYNKKVYRELQKKGSPDWLEEALANYRAYISLEERLKQLKTEGKWKKEEVDISLAFIKEMMASSPRGYRDWRKGYDPLVSREFCNQIITTNIHPNKPYLPLEGLLWDNRHPSLTGSPDKALAIFGVLTESNEVPFFNEYGKHLSGILLPAPKRNKIAKALRTIGYRILKGRGRGSHEFYRYSGKPRKDRIAKSLGWDIDGEKMEKFIEGLAFAYSITIPQNIKRGLLVSVASSLNLSPDEFIRLG